MSGIILEQLTKFFESSLTIGIKKMIMLNENCYKLPLKKRIKKLCKRKLI